MATRLKVVQTDDNEAVNLIVKALALIDELQDYAVHHPCCPHPYKKCDCGLPELLVKAKLFGSG